MGCHFLLQRVFLTQGSNPSHPHWQADSLSRSHRGRRQWCSPIFQLVLRVHSLSQGENGICRHMFIKHKETEQQRTGETRLLWSSVRMHHHIPSFVLWSKTRLHFLNRNKRIIIPPLWPVTRTGNNFVNPQRVGLFSRCPFINLSIWTIVAEKPVPGDLGRVGQGLLTEGGAVPCPSHGDSDGFEIQLSPGITVVRTSHTGRPSQGTPSLTSGDSSVPHAPVSQV